MQKPIIPTSVIEVPTSFETATANLITQLQVRLAHMALELKHLNRALLELDLEVQKLNRRDKQ